MSDGTTLTGSESGGWLDGFWGWAGEFAGDVASEYSNRWLDEEFPERTEPGNPDHIVDPDATAAQQPVGYQLDNKTLLIGAGLIVAVLLLK